MCVGSWTNILLYRIIFKLHMLLTDLIIQYILEILVENRILSLHILEHDRDAQDVLVETETREHVKYAIL